MIFSLISLDEISDEAVIWRYIRLSQLIEILEGCLWFTSLASFEDQEEVNWYRIDGLKGISDFARRIYASCWCEDDVDLEYMWHRPSNPELAICTTIGGLKSALALVDPSESADDFMFLGRVKYTPDPVTVPKSSSIPMDIAVTKNSGFKGEQEIRLGIFTDTKLPCLERRKDSESDALGVRITDLRSLLGSIYMPPNRDLRLESPLQMLLQRYGLEDVPIRESGLRRNFVNKA